jgi:hypothetical protein
MKRSMKFLRAGPGGPVMTPSWLTSVLAVMTGLEPLHPSSWPGLSLPSTSSGVAPPEEVNTRDKRGHDQGKIEARA